MTHLEEASTPALIAELFSRATFAGVLIYSPEEHRRDGQVHDDFILQSSTTNQHTLLLLEEGISSVKKVVQEGEL